MNGFSTRKYEADAAATTNRRSVGNRPEMLEFGGHMKGCCQRYKL
jgi:hypothetical protein